MPLAFAKANSSSSPPFFEGRIRFVFGCKIFAIGTFLLMLH